ncbi:MAG TPA: tRNA (adenosine(37)-N6)-threonylcarbamoyltransferase complex dimerization subunit type 1 TsaB [Gemmatimonadaceae bacterium]|jgi:tRNA threonylcarbamoyladenosine biosynthesis protein TsaB
MKSDVTLAIEGATYQGSVALIRGSAVVAERTLSGADGGLPRSGRGEMLMPSVVECLQEAGVTGKDVSRVVCGAGPGSFTSLRVAGSIAKGLASGYGVELFAVSSLLLTVAARDDLAAGRYLSLLDAMRREFYTQRVEVAGNGVVRRVGAVGIILATDIQSAMEQESDIHLVGPGQPVAAIPHARGVARLLDDILAAGPVDIASWEPDYGRLAEAQVRWEAEHGRPLAP